MSYLQAAITDTEPVTDTMGCHLRYICSLVKGPTGALSCSVNVHEFTRASLIRDLHLPEVYQPIDDHGEVHI